MPKTKNFKVENLNPEGKNIGDCVLRAISKIEENVLSYEQIKEEILKNSKDDTTYNLPIIYEPFLEKLGYKKISANGLVNKKSHITRYAITTFNMATLLAKEINTPVLGVSYTHMAACMNDGKLYDSWDSGRRRIHHIFIKDADKLFEGIDVNEDCWFERKPNGTIILYDKKNKELAKWKDGEKIA